MATALSIARASFEQVQHSLGIARIQREAVQGDDSALDPARGLPGDVSEAAVGGLQVDDGLGLRGGAEEPPGNGGKKGSEIHAASRGRYFRLSSRRLSLEVCEVPV